MGYRGQKGSDPVYQEVPDAWTSSPGLGLLTREGLGFNMGVSRGGYHRRDFASPSPRVLPSGLETPACGAVQYAGTRSIKQWQASVYDRVSQEKYPFPDDKSTIIVVMVCRNKSHT